MKASVHFLNVGWGDAHFISLPSGCLTLIDGGDELFTQQVDSPLAWMNRHHFHTLDWLILTHLHADHLLGLIKVAKAKVVKRAILPYEPFELPSKDVIFQQGNVEMEKVYCLLENYLDLIRILTEQGTELIWRNAYSSASNSIIWSEEGVSLSHLYPWEGDPLIAWEMLNKALSGWTKQSADWEELFQQFFDLSNHDSSVYRLTCDELEVDEGVLFGGDQLAEGWERLAKRINLYTSVWKVPHHGMADGFNKHTLRLVQPKYCVAPISSQHATKLQTHWQSLLSSTSEAQLLITGDVPLGEQKCIVDGIIKVYIGS